MRLSLKSTVVLLLLCLAPAALVAQENVCPALVQSAVELTRESCAELENTCPISDLRCPLWSISLALHCQMTPDVARQILSRNCAELYGLAA